MSLPDSIGIESRIKHFLPPGDASGSPTLDPTVSVGMVRAQFRLEPHPQLGQGEVLDVVVTAQVFDRDYVEKYRRTSEELLRRHGSIRVHHSHPMVRFERCLHNRTRQSIGRGRDQAVR